LIKPNQFDVLIFGAMVSGTAFNVPFVGVQVTDQKTGIPWAADNILPFIPLSAFGGLNTNMTSLFKWPEPYFLQRLTALKFDFTLIDTTIGAPGPITVTLVGVQLVSPANQPPADKLVMPDGSQIRVNQRMPMFLTVPVGPRVPSQYNFSLQGNNVTGNQAVQYLPPIDCDMEVHDASLSIISARQDINITVNLLVKLTPTGIAGGWTQNYTPATAVFGGPGGFGGGASQVYPALPFSKPYLLPKDHRMRLQQTNNNAGTALSNAYITFRGVRLCTY
jgi:hypothetical protein